MVNEFTRQGRRSRLQYPSHTSLTYSVPVVTFVETLLFSRLVYSYLSDDEYAALPGQLARLPDSGDVVPGTGGARKVRVAANGRGKRGGVRVVYVARTAKGVIWMLTIYAKNEVDNIPTNVLRRIREELDNG